MQLANLVLDNKCLQNILGRNHNRFSEGFHLLTDLNGGVSKRTAHQLRWNRTVNVCGRRGQNIHMNLANGTPTIRNLNLQSRHVGQSGKHHSKRNKVNMMMKHGWRNLMPHLHLVYDHRRVTVNWSYPSNRTVTLRWHTTIVRFSYGFTVSVGSP